MIGARRPVTEPGKEKLVWDVLAQVIDPEIPTVSLVDLGIVRSVDVMDDAVRVVLVPTFAGCPALAMMKETVEDRLRSAGFRGVSVEISLSHPWSTDLISEGTLDKLRAAGIAAPARKVQLGESSGHPDRIVDALAQPVRCPFCNSERTRLDSFFGSTLCRQIYYCDECRQSFDRFKTV